jgi:hypothetical protein
MGSQLIRNPRNKKKRRFGKDLILMGEYAPGSLQMGFSKFYHKPAPKSHTPGLARRNQLLFPKGSDFF